MIEMYMSEDTVVGFVAMGKVLAVLLNTLVVVFLVPILNLLGNFWIYITILVDEIDTFVKVDDDVEEGLDAPSRLEDGGYHWYAEQLTELLIVDGIASLLKLVVHIQRANHARVHVDELCGEIEVALKVACVEHIEDDVWGLVDNLPAHVYLLGRIG